MLVLTRRLHEEIVINDDIRLQILEARNGRFRIGITAPKHMQVHRLEIWRECQEEKLRGGITGEDGPAKGTAKMPSAA